MNKPNFVIQITERTRGGGLSSFNLQKIKNFLLMNGGVVIPSDSGYSFATLEINRAKHDDLINRLKSGNATEALSFSNMRFLEQRVTLCMKTASVIEQLTPGPLILVHDKEGERKSFYNTTDIEKDEYTQFKISDSIIEREIASCSNYPIVTIELKKRDNTPIRDSNELHKVLEKVFHPSDSWALVEGADFYSKEPTVVKYNKKQQLFELIREGVISFDRIQKASDEYPLWGIEDWT